MEKNHDIVSPATRSRMMKAVRQADTSAEKAVRAILRELGVHYRLNVRNLPGSPDVSNRRRGWAIFVHGCFWHGHRNCKKTKGGTAGRVPKSNRSFWEQKLDSNRERDNRKLRQLQRMGLRATVVWECEMADPDALARRLGTFLGVRSEPEVAVSSSRKAQSEARLSTPMKVVGLFAGIGGLELGLSRAGHSTTLLSEVEPGAQRVLRRRFPEIELVPDVRDITALPRDVELVTAGFPCQDLSQAGETKGIQGKKSGIVSELFRLIRKTRVPFILIENVPFMLQLGGGAAISMIIEMLESLGYSWAYRVLDTRAFGLPQRRERVFLLASTVLDPADVLLSDDAEVPPATSTRGRAFGFYWTEGLRGLGWAVDSVPTLKGGSGLGIPSPPAIWIRDAGEDRIVTPDIRDAERLQGFKSGWTAPSTDVCRQGHRWKLVGNAVTVNVAAWIGKRLRAPRTRTCPRIGNLASARSWPRAACGSKRGWHVIDASSWPVSMKQKSLLDFLRYPLKPLSMKATAGFLKRLRSGHLRYPPEFLDALESHLRQHSSQTHRPRRRPACKTATPFSTS